MNIILFDTNERCNLFPLTLTRAVADIRMGILTIRERWKKITVVNVYILTETYLQPLYEEVPPGEYIFLDARIIPLPGIIRKIGSLNIGDSIADNKGFIAARCTIDALPVIENLSTIFKNVTSIEPVKRLEYPAQMFQWNDEMLQFDFDLTTKRRISATTNESVHLVKSSKIFIEEGAEINFSILNASTGTIYIGKNTVIMENCSIRGPFCLGEGAVMKMGTKMYGATTVGPYCTVGGEIKNSILTGYSNKAHDGYLGDSVIGEWCNFGAGTSNSNLKNNAGEVKIWNYQLKDYLPVGNKCGVIMGDYSRTAINASINTGTVIGVNCNVFGEGLTPKFIPDFSWGFGAGSKYDYNKAINDIINWKKTKNKTLSEPETNILKHIFDNIKDNSTP